MKKMLALVLSVVLLFGLLPMAIPVTAELSVDFKTATWNDGNLTLAWNQTETTGYAVSKVRLNGTQEMSIQSNTGRLSINASDFRPGQTAEVGFVADGTQTIEWVAVPTVSFSVKTGLDAYKSDNYIHIQAEDQFGNALPAGTRVTITLDDGVQKVPLTKLLDDNGAAIADVRNFVNFIDATISVEEATVGNITYLTSSVKVDMTAKDLTVQTKMTLSSVSGKVAATVVDESGAPLDGVPVVLDFGSNSGYKTVVTDANGVALFDIDAASTMKIVCRVGDWMEGHVTYKGCTATFAPATSSSTSSTTTTTTDETDEGSTTKTTASTTEGFGLITGVGTTMHPSGYEGYIAVDALFDTGVLDAFGLSEQDFRNRAQLLLKEDEYEDLLEDDAMLMLSIRYSDAKITKEQIRKSIKSNKDLSAFKDEQISVVTAVLSAQLLKSSGEVIPLELEDSEYLVRLPIPASMQSARAIAVAQCLEDGITKSIVTSMEDGYFEFPTDNLVELVVLGFSAEAAPKKDTNPLTVVFTILGVLLVLGAGAIVYFAAFHKSQQQEEDGVTDLYSDDPETAEQEDEGDIVVAPMEDEGDLPPVQYDLFEEDIVLPDLSDDQ